MEDFLYITIRTIFFQIIALILMFTLVKTPEDYIIYACISVISSAGANIINIFYKRKYCKIKFTMQMDFKKHIKPIIILFIMISAQTILNSSDVTMLGLMKGDFEVGIYSTAVKVSNLICTATNSVIWVMMPRLVIYFNNENYEEINKMLKKVLETMLLLGLPCAIGCICLSEEIVLIMAGEEFLASAQSLKILMISFIFTLLGEGFLGNMILLPSKKENLYMKICCCVTIINVILNLFFIRIGGAIAAASTTAISTFVMFLMLIKVKDKKIKLKEYIWKIVKAPIAGCIGIIVICFVVKVVNINLILNAIVSVLGSVLIYFVTLIVFKNEICIDMIQSLKNKVKLLKNKI